MKLALFRSGSYAALASLFALLLHHGPGAASQRANATPAERGRAWMRQFVEAQGVPGAAVAVAVDGKIALAEGFGVANLETETPATPRTLFRIGSVTKLLTAAALARLHQDGRLELDAPVQKYAPQFPEKTSPITIRQLAGHLGGIRHYRGNEFFNAQRVATIADALKRFQEDPLLHEPGSKYAYSSYGYVLLGAVLEGASGKDFATLVREGVLTPLNMESTAPDFPERVIGQRSGYYGKTREGQIQNGPYMDTTDRLPAGGYLASVEDLARFGAAFAGDSFLSRETRELMFTSQKTPDGKETRVGLGWRIARDSQGRRFVHHGGDSVGGRAFLLVYPEQRVVVAFAANLSFVPFAEKQALQIAGFFLEGK